jgi:hypothetical protein
VKIASPSALQFGAYLLMYGSSSVQINNIFTENYAGVAQLAEQLICNQ